MRNLFSLGLLICFTTVFRVAAGTFVTDFNSGTPSGATPYGTAFVDTTGGTTNSGCLKMTSNAPNQSAGFILDDLDAGAAISGFTVTFQLALGTTNGTPADGFSFNYGSVPDGTIDEEGAGVSGLTVEFDTFTNNSTSDLVGIDLKWQGTEFATHPMTPAALAIWPKYTNVFIQLTNGKVNLSYNGTNIYTNVVIPGYTPIAGRFGLGARTGGSTENCFVDNLSISTTPILHPIVLTDSPTGINVQPNPVISIQLFDGSISQVDQNTLQMKFDGTAVTPSVSQNGGLTTVQYTPSALPSGSSNWVMLTFSDNSGSPVSQTNVFGFIVLNYPTIPTNYMATADISQPGFTERIFEGGTATVASAETADTMLAGLYYNTADGTLFPNTAQTNTDGTWTFLQPGVLNYNIFSPTNTTTAGNFSGDALYPGLPGTNGSLVNFGYEAVTYLYLTPGLYTFGVNSDDGFRLTSLDVQLGTFDAGRGAADTIMYFAVTQPGYYPFRLVHFQGTGSGSLEWFSVDSSGNKILINDTGSGGISAYAKVTTALPYFVMESPSGTGNRADKPIQVQIQDGVGVLVNTNTIHLRVNGAAVSPSITRTGGVTTVQYSAAWASGSANTGMVWFADNQVSPVSQTNQFTFSVSTFTSIPASYAISAGAVDATKPGYLQKVFQTDHSVPNTIANAETMLAGQLLDPLGNPYPNKAGTNTDGSYNFAQTNVINYNLAAPATAGDFPGDVQFPGMPGPSGSTNTFALEGITYIYLPVGYYALGVNSDDGFRLTTSPNPHEEFPLQLAAFDGTRLAADTLATGFGITNAGYYPFRLVYYQGSGPASLELFSTTSTGTHILLNDTNNPAALRSYRSANNTQPYVQWAYPYRAGTYFLPAAIPVYFTLVDGTPAVQQSSIRMTFNGTSISPTITSMNGTNIVVSYLPTSFQRTSNFTATVQLVWADVSGHSNTNAFNFLFYGSESLAPLWSLSPGSRPYLTNDFSATALEAGMAYNPVSGHLLVGSLANSNNLRGFYILDPLTGNDLGQLRLTNSSGVNVFSPLPAGVNYPGYSVGVADDGVIYAASRQKDSSQKYAIYRWANETSPVSVAYGPTTVGTQPFGYDFRVRGAGTSTQIIVGQGNSATPGSFALLFTTANGSTFAFTAFGPITGGNNDYYGGIGFAGNNTVYAGGFPAPVLEYVNFSNKVAIASYPWAATSGSIGPFCVDLVNGRVIALGTSTTGGAAHTVNLFDLSALTNGVSTPADAGYLATTNANPSGSGSVAITPNGGYAFVLDSQNGITAYELTVKSATIPLAPTTLSIGVGPGSNHTIRYSGGQAVSYVLLSSQTVNTPIGSWSPVATNSGTQSSSNFVVAPGGARVFYRVSSRNN